VQHSATHCSTLQHTAAHCNTVHHSAAQCNTRKQRDAHYLMCDRAEVHLCYRSLLLYITIYIIYIYIQPVLEKRRLELSSECQTKSKSESGNYRSRSPFIWNFEKRPRTTTSWFRFGFHVAFWWPFESHLLGKGLYIFIYTKPSDHQVLFDGAIGWLRLVLSIKS